MPSPSDRDAALGRISGWTKWVAVLAAALVAVFSGLAAAARPGHAVHSAQAPSSTSTSTSTSTSQDPGLQPPAQAPAPSAPATSGPVSGGS